MQVKFYYKDGVKPLQYQTNGSSGVDLAANEDITLFSGCTGIVPTGVFTIIPYRYEGQVRSRSGLALKGIFVANSPGTLDSDFRGEIKVILYNSNSVPYLVKKGDRIAQLVFVPISKPEMVIFDDFKEFQSESITIRGQNGFGSTGI